MSEKTRSSFSSEWEKEKYKHTKYSERTKESIDDLNKEIAKFEKNSIATPTEVQSSTTINFENYRKEIEKFDNFNSNINKAA